MPWNQPAARRSSKSSGSISSACFARAAGGPATPWRPTSPIPPPLAETGADAVEPAGSAPLEQVEREHISRMLRESGGKVTTAATRLGLHRTTLNAMMRKLGISRKDL